MATRKLTDDPRRRFYPLANPMRTTAQRIRWMCQDQAYYRHAINQHHVLLLDDAFSLHFQRDPGPAGAVRLYLEVTQQGKPTGAGLKSWWPVIQQWRDLLREWHGRQGRGTIAERRFEAELESLHHSGASNKTIAVWVNQQIREAGPSLATKLIQYFTPQPVDVDDPDPITDSHIREHLRYRRNTSR